MADKPSPLPRLTAEQRRVVAGQFERAKQVVAKGDFDYGIQLLLNCCKMDAGNSTYRQTLRKTVRAKFKKTGGASWLAQVGALKVKLRVKAAAHKQDYLKVLEHGEEVLVRTPDDVGTHLAMSDAFAHLELVDLAIWTLELARQGKSNPVVNRALARLYEKRGNFAQAMALWEAVRKACPTDVEAQHKAKDLAASATIAKGKYEDVISGAARPPSGTAAAPAPEETAEKGPSAQEERMSREVAQLHIRIQAEPTSASAYLSLAALYRKVDLFDQAKQVLQQGLGPTGNHFAVALELADLEIEPLRRDLAITQERLQSQPKDAELLKIRDELKKEINLRELNYYRQKSERFPNEMAHKYEMGVRLYYAGQHDEAIRELQAARGNPAFHGRSLFYLGVCFKMRNNWRLGQRNLEEALQHLGPKDEDMRKELLYQLATGYAEAGELARAVDLGFELANVDFTFRDIGKLLDEWQERLQKA